VLPTSWYPGPWRVIEGGAAARPRPRVGEIVRHPNGLVLLIVCPACRALQFVRAGVAGPADAPTVDRPVQCGAGVCRACGVWFGVASGVTVQAQPPAAATVRVSDSLARAGVHPPPALPVPPGPRAVPSSYVAPPGTSPGPRPRGR